MNSAQLDSALSPSSHLDYPHSSWHACLDLHFVQVKQATTTKTVLHKSHHIGPLRLQRPFYPEQDLAHIYLLHPPGGVVGGDQLEIHIHADESAQLLATTPGSGKFYLSAGDWAHYHQSFQIKDQASLEWFPQENILFSGAKLKTHSSIELHDSAQFMGWEITCFGRPECDEHFLQGAFNSRLELYHNQQLLLIENQAIDSAQQLASSTGLRNYPVQATMIVFPCSEANAQMIQQQFDKLPAGMEVAATLIDNILVIRGLGHNTEALKMELIRLWKILRPLILGRFAVPPRIWST